MPQITRISIGLAIAVAAIFCTYYVITRTSIHTNLETGARIDELNGVGIFYNGGVNQSHGRNLAADGYNIGIKYQCVEFIKRYYLEKFSHKMPDSYGHAKSFFDDSVPDGELNKKRGLLQFKNDSSNAPIAEDIIVFSPSLLNPYGHVAIIAEVNSYAIVIAQQNAGPIHSSREAIPINQRNGIYHVGNSRVLGWLRLPKTTELSATNQPLNSSS